MPQIAPASLAEGERIYAVGDVHGRLDRSDEIHDMISDDLIGRPTQSPTIIHLGDYIDRGPDSAAVLSRLAEPIARIAHVKIVNLMGNHEAMFLAALNDEPGAFKVWVRNGGDTCVQSWGVDLMSWKGLVPQEHIRFIKSLHLMRGHQERRRCPLCRDQPERPVGKISLREGLLQARPGGKPDQAAQGPACLRPDQLPLANQMRLILHTAAYWLVRTVRDVIPKTEPLASGEFSTIRLRLLKIAVRVRETGTRIRLAFAANCPDAALFRDLIGALIPRPT